MDLIHIIASVTKKPLVLVLMGGSPVDVSFAKHDPHIASILWIGYPGEFGWAYSSTSSFWQIQPRRKSAYNLVPRTLNPSLLFQ
ncbi:hypothetical protein GUJ93_ZPchr0014g46982 [Zizania palustris]|uniref:Glycoside hydrolase family 3 C-terminal domain-containing protein n=1 Tax=Zizania palustris TaxID=103762 RepID=A0A8J5VV59_ZIZPA|nr:hypothetical protein GUJ93_ZPchr0014g46982 [Zizania palustris]